MTFKELKAAVKGRFMNWGKYTAEKLENVSAIFESTTTEDVGKVLTVGEDGSPEWGEGGGGSSLPPYTSADKGKGLFLGDGEGTETVVIVPEQTVTIADGEGNDLTGYDFSSVSIGDVLQVTINGVTKNVEYEQGIGTLTRLTFDEEGIVILCSIESLPQFVRILNAEDGTYTVSVSASVPSVEPKWEGDFIIRVTGEARTGGEYYLECDVDKTAAEIEARFTPFYVGRTVLLLPAFDFNNDGYSYEIGYSVHRDNWAFLNGEVNIGGVPIGGNDFLLFKSEGKYIVGVNPMN